jgi:hypothetical protein
LTLLSGPLRYPQRQSAIEPALRYRTHHNSPGWLQGLRARAPYNMYSLPLKALHRVYKKN